MEDLDDVTIDLVQDVNFNHRGCLSDMLVPVWSHTSAVWELIEALLAAVLVHPEFGQSLITTKQHAVSAVKSFASITGLRHHGRTATVVALHGFINDHCKVLFVFDVDDVLWAHLVPLDARVLLTVDDVWNQRVMVQPVESLLLNRLAGCIFAGDLLLYFLALHDQVVLQLEWAEPPICFAKPTFELGFFY